MYWRVNNKRKSQWSMRWLGPGIVIGHEGRANVWISHRNAVVKAARNHVRLAEVEEQLPWHDICDPLRDTDEQTYFDLSQYGGPSTSSDVPMTLVPATDGSMPDAIANEPDTSEIPVLPNSVHTPVRNALALRCFGTLHATDCFTTCCVFAKCACSNTIMVSTHASHP